MFCNNFVAQSTPRNTSGTNNNIGVVLLLQKMTLLRPVCNVETEDAAASNCTAIPESAQSLVDNGEKLSISECCWNHNQHTSQQQGTK